MKFFDKFRAQTPLAVDVVPAPVPAGRGDALLATLDARTQGFRRGYIDVGQREDSLSVNPDALIDAKRPGSARRVLLDASHVASGAILMAAPSGKDEVQAFIDACVRQPIAQVIDLTEDNDVAGSARFGVSAVRDLTGQTEFQPAGKGRWHLDGLGERSSEFRASAKAADPGREDDTGAAAADPSRKMVWTRVPLEVDRTVSPDMMLAMCERIAHNARDVGDSVAFMDSNGGSLAATFAAAHAIFRAHQETPWTSAEEAVLKACALQRSRRSQELFSGRPDLLHMLEQFTRRLIAQGGEPASRPGPRENPDEPASEAAPRSASPAQRQPSPGRTPQEQARLAAFSQAFRDVQEEQRSPAAQAALQSFAQAFRDARDDDKS
ncbi:hypothetical protein [Mitsuaria sp. GD03876]|uniref:hypothetical protein n=1 Tax=Mitsuaria sp. GD03876 TaxID=2975399 RepID=UPI00244A62B6|nr:hypothetical protein [Mitsuaria sp. GD03876]MDH0868262.1 hypothetical protein [Mitsuaria sp. GD03876]